MRLLLDTHLALWWQVNDSRLSSAARDLVGSNDDDVFVSRVSLWEMAIKQNAGKLRIDLADFASRVEAMGFRALAIENSHILQLSQVPLFPDHKDPFDRMLVAQAATESLVLLTVDAKMSRYGDFVRLV